MFSKPFSLISVYILTIINFTIFSLPLFIAALPFIHFDSGKVIISQTVFSHLKLSLIFLVFLISFLMLCYLFLDFIFGFSFRATLKGSKRYDKIKNYEFLEEIFSQVKGKFNENRVKLYIKNSEEINAFAVGSFGRKAIVLTAGIINHYFKHTKNNQEFLLSIRSIMGHEMSHLVNKDFIPGLIILVNQKITNMASGVLNKIFKLFVSVLAFFGITNRYLNNLMFAIYNLLNKLLHFFNNHVVYNLYEFLRKYISRGTEFRCDRQSAKAFGGYNMAVSLSFLGKSGYFTLFSTHPRTQARIKRVENIRQTEGKIGPSIITSISNYIAWMFLVIICLYCAKASKVDLMIRNYSSNTNFHL